jgi:hypothetical protein
MKRQWFPSQDSPQLVQVTRKKKQWFPPQDGLNIGATMHEKVTHIVKLLFYAYETVPKKLQFQESATNEGEVYVEEVTQVEVQVEEDTQVEVQVEEAAQVEVKQVAEPEPVPMCTQKKCEACCPKAHSEGHLIYVSVCELDVVYVCQNLMCPELDVWSMS